MHWKREEREALCSPFMFGWLMRARSFIFIIYNDKKLLFSSLSHTLVFFLVFQLYVFCFAQNVSLHFLHISIFSFLSFFVILCWTSHRFLCSDVVGIHSWIRMTAKSITHMLVSCINIYLRWSSHKCSGKTGLLGINISYSHSSGKYTFRSFNMFCIPIFFIGHLFSLKPAHNQ